MSKADDIFKNMCSKILSQGYSSKGQKVRAKWSDGTPAHTIKMFGIVNEYGLSEEFPALTLRPTAIKLAVGELLWIWQRKSNNIKDLNSSIWDEWADENGSIGKAYGYQMAKKYKFAQGEMDQVDNVIWQLKNNPYSRRILTNIYNFSDISEMNLEPCAYSMTFNVTGDKLNGILNQRSQDILAANNWNVVQYSVLLHLLSKVCGFKPGKLVHVIADAHIYDRHIPMIEDLISRKSYDAPKFSIDDGVDDFYKFSTDDIKVENYKAGPQITDIPIAI